MQNPGARIRHCTPQLREFAAIPPSADNAAAFATCAILRSPARQPYEKIRPRHASAVASALATDLCATEVSNACVCLLGDV